MTPTPALVRVIAVWQDALGNHYEWPMATSDNRRARVLARIEAFGMDCDPETLTLVKP